MVRLKLDNAPTGAVITTAEAKEFLRVTHSAEDTMIDSMVNGAVEVAQNYMNRKILEYEYTLFMEDWNDVYVSNSYASTYRDILTNETIYGGYYSKFTGLPQIILPFPLASTTFIVKYTDVNRVSQVLTTSFNLFVYENQKGFLELKDTETLPEVYPIASAIEITFTAGMARLASDVPDAIKQAILLILGKMYELREDSVSRLPKASEYILDPYRIKTY